MHSPFIWSSVPFTFPSATDRFQLGSPDKASDPPDRQEEFVRGVEFLPGRGDLQFSRQTKVRGPIPPGYRLDGFGILSNL
jgi:hypothetical protein